tara:strand:+ start:2525 stop:2764 length:240 start_codon:yes stop_codon:yes gene_type:complete
MNEELMDKIIEKCKEDPAYAEAFDHLLKVSQAAAIAGFSNEELASVCMMGWMIGTDPDLGEMINNMAKISKMGLDIVEK